MRFYFEREEAFWNASYDGEQLTITEGSIGDAGTTETHELEDEADALKRVRSLAYEKLNAGFEHRRPPEERYEQGDRVLAYWNDGVLDDWKALGAVESDTGPAPERWAELHATPIEGELARFLEWRSSHRFGFCNFGEWRIHDRDVWVADPADGNLFEQLVVLDQDNVLGTAMMEIFARWVFIGHAGNGDFYFAHLDPLDPLQHEVVFYDHEESRPTIVCADSPSSFAWLNRCMVALDEGDVERDQLTADMAELDGRVELSWHFDPLEEETEFEPGYEERSDALYLFHQFVWLDSLLRQSPLDDFDEIGELFYQVLHRELSFERARQFPMSTSDALYWVWRLFWFDKPQLEECLELVEDHASPVVRDAVALVREFLCGRKELGKIDDVFALRDRFIALDVDPDRAEERAREAEAAERLANAAHYAAVERAEELVAAADVDAMKEALWEIRDDEAVAMLLAQIRQASDHDRLWLRRWEFIANHGSDRDSQAHGREDEELYEVIRREPNPLIGALLGNPESWDNHSWKRLGLATAAVGERMLPHLESAAETRDRILRAPQAAARGFEALADVAHVDTVVGLVEAMGWSEGDVMASISNDDAMLAAIEALGAIGGDRAVEVLKDLSKNAPKKVRPRAIVELGRQVDSSAYDVLLTALSTEFARCALFGLARLGTADAGAAIDAYISKNVGSLDKVAYERGMQQFAALRLDGADAVDWEMGDELRLIIESLKRDDAELHETLAELIVHHPDGSYAEKRLREYLHHEHSQVRSAALDGLAKLGVEFVPRWLDRPHVDLIWETEGVEGLRDALTDPNAVFKHNVVIKAGDEGVGDALDDEILALVDLYCRFTGYTHNYVQDGHKRTYDLVEAMSDLGTPALLRRLCRMWKSPNVHDKGAEYLKHNFDNLHERMQPYVEEVEAELAGEATTFEPELSLTMKPFGTGGGHTGRIRSIRIVGDQVVTTADDKTVLRWSLTGEELARYEAPGVRHATVSNGRLYTITDERATCQELDGTVVWEVEGSFNYWIEIMGDRFVSTTYDAVRIHDRDTGEELWVSKPLAALRCHAPLAHPKLAVAGYQEEWIGLVDVEEMSGEVSMLPAKLQQFGGVWRIAAEGDELFVSRRDDSVVVLDAAGEMLRRGLFDSSFFDIAVSEGSLVTVRGTNLHLYDTQTFELKQDVPIGFGIEEFGVGPGPTIVVGGENGELAIVQ